MREQLYYKRAFLNNEEHGGVAFIEASISRNTGNTEAQLKIGDCNRIIDLDFDTWRDDPDHNSNVRQKAIKLKRVVNQFVSALLEEIGE